MENKGGRPPVFRGCKREHLRVRFTRDGKSRALYARWRPEIQLFEFQLSGYGLHPYCFFGLSKALILCNLRLRSSVTPSNGWRWHHVDDTDWGQHADPFHHYLYADPLPPGLRPTLPAAVKDRLFRLQQVAA